jgi:hypothetical protein
MAARAKIAGMDPAERQAAGKILEKYEIVPRVTPDVLAALIGARLAEETADAFDNKADLADAFDRIAAEAARPYVDSAAATLESAHGAWEPIEDPEPTALWIDLRPSEAVQLMKLVSAACDRIRARCEAIVVDELVTVGKAFLTEYPFVKRNPAKVVAK